ncbi:MAG: hypothetical protein WBL88_11940, partial [Nitrososphaeraceae archaeon]
MGYDIDTQLLRAVALIAYPVSLPIFANCIFESSPCVISGSKCSTCVSRNLDPVCHTWLAVGLSLGCPLSMLYH